MCTEPLAPFVPVFLPDGMFPLFAADHLVNADAGQPSVNDREDDEPLDFGENLGYQQNKERLIEMMSHLISAKTSGIEAPWSGYG